MINKIDSARPSHKSTVKGAVAGAVAGSAMGASLYSLYSVPGMLAKNAKSFSAKKEIVSVFKDQAAKFVNIDFRKTTLSKFYKDMQKSLRNPKTIAAGLAIAAGIGAGIGFVVDCVKNKKANKA